MNPWAPDWFLLGMAVGAGIVLFLTIWLTVNRAWRHATFAGAHLPWLGILGMRLRGTPAALVVDAYVALQKRGRQVHIGQVEATYLAHRAERLDALGLAQLVEQHAAQQETDADAV